MIINRIKKQRGSTLILVLVVLLFLSILGVTNFNSSRTSLRMSNNIYSESMKFQAAEKALSNAISAQFVESSDIALSLQITPVDNIKHCLSDNQEDSGDLCHRSYMNSDNSIRSRSETTMNETSECLAYGSSDQKAYCFIIKGYGEIPVLNSKPTIHVQEIQINTININDNGVYEL